MGISVAPLLNFQFFLFETEIFLVPPPHIPLSLSKTPKISPPRLECRQVGEKPRLMGDRNQLERRKSEPPNSHVQIRGQHARRRKRGKAAHDLFGAVPDRKLWEGREGDQNRQHDGHLPDAVDESGWIREQPGGCGCYQMVWECGRSGDAVSWGLGWGQGASKLETLTFFAGFSSLIILFPIIFQLFILFL